MAIYIVTGWKIFRKGSELHSLSKKVAADQDSANTLHSPHTSTDLRIKVETTMQVETSPPEGGAWDVEATSPASRNISRSSFGSTKQLSSPIESPAPIANTGHFPSSTQKSESSNGYRATAFATNRTKEIDAEPQRSMSITYTNVVKRRPGMKVNAAALGYFKVAFLMFAALVCVWVPSTANRLQQFIQKEKSIFGLNLASALVLPLQGFWNSMIYTSTTWPECKRAWAEILNSFSRGGKEGGSEEAVWPTNSLQNKATVVTHHEFAPSIPLDAVKSSSALSQQHLPSRVSSVSSVEEIRPIPSSYQR
jgi:hypothetical protein